MAPLAKARAYTVYKSGRGHLVRAVCNLGPKRFQLRKIYINVGVVHVDGTSPSLSRHLRCSELLLRLEADVGCPTTLTIIHTVAHSWVLFERVG